MNAIVAVSRSWGIGKGGDLLFHLKKDMRFFRQMTLGKTVVMGRKTLDSFPGGKPLPQRRNIVLTRDRSFSRPGAETVFSIEELLRLTEGLPSEDVFVIGGGEIYRQLLPFCHRIYVTQADADPEASVFFPVLPEEGWHMTGCSDCFEENSLRFHFTIWEKD